MAEKVAKALGTIDPLSGKVSSGRIILYGALVLFFLAFAYVGYMIGFAKDAAGEPRVWTDFEGWIGEFVSGIKYFLVPYLGGAIRDGVVAKKNGG